MFTASLVLYLTLISPLMSLFYSSFSDIYHNHPHISLHLLLLPTTSNFLLSIIPSFIFFYILILVYHNATGLSLLLTPLSLVHTPFLPLILNFLLFTIHLLSILWQYIYLSVTNFIQLVSPQPVDRFSQTKLCWKAPNEGYSHICRMYKSDNKWLRYQDISSCKSFVC